MESSPFLCLFEQELSKAYVLECLFAFAKNSVILLCWKTKAEVWKITVNPLLGAAWPIVYFLQGRLGMAANFMRAYQFICPAIVANVFGVNSR